MGCGREGRQSWTCGLCYHCHLLSSLQTELPCPAACPEESLQATPRSPYALRVKSERLNWIWFHPSSSRMGIVQMKGLTRVVDCGCGREQWKGTASACLRAVFWMHTAVLPQGACYHWYWLTTQPCPSLTHISPLPSPPPSLPLPLPYPPATRPAAKLRIIPPSQQTNLVVGRPEAPPHVLVIQHLDLEAEVLFEVLDDHDQEGQLDAQGLLGVSRAADRGRAAAEQHVVVACAWPSCWCEQSTAPVPCQTAFTLCTKDQPWPLDSAAFFLVLGAAGLLAVPVLPVHSTPMPTHHVMYVDATLSLMISRTDDWMSWSVIRLMCPLRTCARFDGAC